MSAPAGASVEHRVTVLTLRSITARIHFLFAQTAQLDPELLALVRQHPAGPALLAEPGVGPVVAAQLLISWSHRGRVRNEAAFAALAGAAPLEASSGQRIRHRLNRGGDRNLNRALHTIAITRLRCHPETRDYEAQRTAQGKPHRDVRRSLKRALARRLYRRIQAATRPPRAGHRGQGGPLTDIGASNGLLRQYFPTCMRAAASRSGELPVACRRTPGGLTRVLPAASGLALFGCVDPPGVRSRLDSTEA